MGKEEDNAEDPANAALLGFSGLLARTKLQDHGRWMSTPLRAYIARESAGPTPIFNKTSPVRKTLADESSRRRSTGSYKVKGESPGGTVPSSGCSSPCAKISSAAAVAEFWRPVQLGALLAQEREDQTRYVAEEPEPGSISFRSPSPGNRSKRDCKVTKVAPPDVESSQKLQYLFANDWALQTSDEDDEFWDSGTLCGIASPSPRSSRRRSKKLSSKLRHSSSHCTPPAPPTQHLQQPHPSAMPTRSYSCRILAEDAPCAHSSKPSLGALLAEEIVASSSVATEPTWSLPASAHASRRPKIASLSDISTPVRPESQSQLDFLIGKILTLRATRESSATSLATRRCSTSESPQPAAPAAAAETSGGGEEIEEEEEQQELAAHSSSSSSSSSPVTLPATAPTNPSTSEITESPDSPSPSPHEEPFAPSSDAALRDERDDGDEPLELEAPAPERVQLGILLERTREEHGWVSSPLALLAASSSTSAEEEHGWVSSPVVVLAGSSSTSADEDCSSSEPAQNPELVQHEEATTAATATAPELDSSLLVTQAGVTVATAVREERPSTQRVSLLSLLNQDMEMEMEDGVHMEMLSCGGCRLEEEDDDDEPGAETEEELDPMCCVCMVGRKGAAFIPCGHTFCRKCCREVRRSLGSCPLCNQAIVDVLKLY